MGSFQAYIINLEHATERWSGVRTNLESLQIHYTRIEGVYGDKLPDDVDGYNRLRYNITHGKTTNKRKSAATTTLKRCKPSSKRAMNIPLF